MLCPRKADVPIEENTIISGFQYDELFLACYKIIEYRKIIAKRICIFTSASFYFVRTLQINFINSLKTALFTTESIIYLSMENRLVQCILLAVILSACVNEGKKCANWKKRALDVASVQLLNTAKQLADSNKLPRSTYTGYETDFLVEQMEQPLVNFQDSLWPNFPADKLGKLRLCTIYDWTSGFFPGCLWYAYELTGKEELKEQAVKYTNLLNPIRHYKDNHDIGFMMNCSYGNALRLSPADTIQDVLRETADNLCERFDSRIGCIRS